MFGGNWREHIAAGLVLAVALATAILLEQYVQNEGPQSNAQQEQAEAQAYPFGQGQQASTDYEALCRNPKTVGDRDLCQQWRMAEAAQDLYQITKLEVFALALTVFFTAYAAIAAARAAGAANKAVEVTERTAKSQLRAYVTVEDNQINVVGNGIDARIAVINCGQTPAYRLRGWLNVEIHERDSAKDLPIEPIDPSTASTVLGPNLKSTVTRSYQPLPIDAAGKEICVWGRVEYTDIFGNDHWTEFRVSTPNFERGQHRGKYDHLGNRAS